MGREVKRVVAGFDWPLNEVWQGFLMPENLHSKPCPAGDDCRNGNTRAGAWVMSISRMLLMLDDDLDDQARGRDLHPYLRDVPTYSYGTRPSQDIREFGAGLAGREGGFLGHDAIDGWDAYEKVVVAAGLDPKAWGICPTCKGNAFVEAYPGQEAAANAWEATEPPAGDWWQVWETVSEGSPVTPAFATSQELAEYLSENPKKLGPGSTTLAAADALAWLEGPAWSPSGMSGPGGFKSGAELLKS